MSSGIQFSSNIRRGTSSNVQPYRTFVKVQQNIGMRNTFVKVQQNIIYIYYKMSDPTNTSAEAAEIIKANEKTFPFYFRWGCREGPAGQLNIEEADRNIIDNLNTELRERMQPVHDELHHVMYAFLSCLDAPMDTIKNFITPLPTNPDLPTRFNLEYKLNNAHYPIIDQFFNDTKQLDNCSVPINDTIFEVKNQDYTYANKTQKSVNIKVNDDIEYDIFRLEIQMSDTAKNTYTKQRLYDNMYTFPVEYFKLKESKDSKDSNIFGKLNTINTFFKTKKRTEPTFYYTTEARNYNRIVPNDKSECNKLKTIERNNICNAITPSNKIFTPLGKKQTNPNNFNDEKNSEHNIIFSLLRTISVGACCPNKKGCNLENERNSLHCLDQLHSAGARYNLLLTFRTCNRSKKTELILISAYTPSYDKEMNYVAEYENKFVYTFKNIDAPAIPPITFHHNLSRYERVCQSANQPESQSPVEYDIASPDSERGYASQQQEETFEGFGAADADPRENDFEGFKGGKRRTKKKKQHKKRKTHKKHKKHFSKKHFSKKCHKTLRRKCKKTLFHGTSSKVSQNLTKKV